MHHYGDGILFQSFSCPIHAAITQNSAGCFKNCLVHSSQCLILFEERRDVVRCLESSFGESLLWLVSWYDLSQYLFSCLQNAILQILGYMMRGHPDCQLCNFLPLTFSIDMIFFFIFLFEPWNSTTCSTLCNLLDIVENNSANCGWQRIYSI